MQRGMMARAVGDRKEEKERRKKEEGGGKDEKGGGGGGDARRKEAAGGDRKKRRAATSSASGSLEKDEAEEYGESDAVTGMDRIESTEMVACGSPFRTG